MTLRKSENYLSPTETISMNNNQEIKIERKEKFPLIFVKFNYIDH
jgi:hypothetical protein